VSSCARTPGNAVSASNGTTTLASEIPERLADTTFWRLITEFSEPGGYFRSDNFVSNETSFQYVIPELQRTIKPGGVYLGVAPDQNFTYLVALKPKIAFIVDIRRQNLIQHLMYKALIETSADRADFMSALFARPRPDGVSAESSVEKLFLAYGLVPTDTARFRKNLAAMTDWLTERKGFALSPTDLQVLEYVYRAFVTAGPDITYAFPNGGGRGFGRWPSYAQLMLESDGQGANRSYLANEANFRVLKDMESRNVIVPLVGNFSGDKTLRTVGRYLKERGATVTAFYTSNVEQYLFQQADDWNRFYANVATLPLDSTSTFIRSLSNGNGFRPGSPNSRSVQLLSSITELLKAVQDGRVQTYYDMIQLSK
ncbi:MAG TPA: hypothetical protein VFZ21_08105, partial [Gemmatimonadaceae bacterium]|nr:hypothetical protein [Gemmatimonadaceae bacterium]